MYISCPLGGKRILFGFSAPRRVRTLKLKANKRTLQRVFLKALAAETVRTGEPVSFMRADPFTLEFLMKLDETESRLSSEDLDDEY